MSDFGLISLINRLLRTKTRGEAEILAGDAADQYSEVMWELVKRLSWPRTGKQNNNIHAWFAEIGRQTGEEPIEVKRRAKLDIGTIILCRDDPEFLEWCKLAMGNHKDRKTRLKMMDYTPVTSIMTTKQLSEFHDTFERIHRAEGYTLSEKAA